MSRKRGAQHGNKNSYKHGFYSSQFDRNERQILNQMPYTDLTGEIELVRIANKRFLDALNDLPQPLDVKTQLSVLHAITLSAESINSMIRTQIILAQANGESDEIRAKLMAISDKDDDTIVPPISER